MKLNIYDFDGTIYDGDSSIDFIKYLMIKKKSNIFSIPKMIYNFIKHKLKLISKEQMKECFFEILNNFSNIDEIIDDFWKKNEYKIKDFFKNTKQKNVVIASASPYFLLEPIAKKYKIKDLFASPIDKKTGKYDGVNCHGVEKVRLIHKKYPKHIVETMYSDDAKADKPLLDLAKKSYIVKKNKIINYKEYKPNIIKRSWDLCWGIYHKNEEIWNYLIVGGLTTVISLVVYYLCVTTFLDANKALELQIANIISWIIAVLFAYVTNRVFVFKSKEKNILKESTSFIGSRIITLLLDMLTMFILVTLLHGNDKIGKIVSQIIVIVGNYIISKLFVFKNKNS